jgi:hypothetical protein
MEEMAAKQKSSIEDKGNEISELGYDYAWRSVDRATSHFDRTDSKISSMGGSVGVMLSIISTLIPTVFLGGQFTSGFALISQVLFIVGGCLLAISLVCCISSAWLRETTEWPLTKEFIKLHLSIPEDKADGKSLRQAFIECLSRVDESFVKTTRQKQKHLRGAGYALILGVITLILSGFAFTTHMIVSNYAAKSIHQSK